MKTNAAYEAWFRANDPVKGHSSYHESLRSALYEFARYAWEAADQEGWDDAMTYATTGRNPRD